MEEGEEVKNYIINFMASFHPPSSLSSILPFLHPPFLPFKKK